MRPFIPACCPDDVRRDGVLWGSPCKPHWWREAVRKASALAEVLDAENKRLCEQYGTEIAEDLAAQERAERERLRTAAENLASAKDLADSVAAAMKEAAPLFAAMAVQRRKERRAIRREEVKLREDVKKLVRLKVQRFKAGRYA